ncbi:MAG: prepilin-type N-terminal cleavage/methylation domain-containing protein [Candidatus Kerfeldbacteria bacterium]|nr:prepilin-type N-terminal cleavage/methylation domain-containing protein [Candidatus Kerfeldbacteria bacterium]
MKRRTQHTVPLCTRRAGFTLVESLVGIAIFAIIAVGVYRTYSTTAESIRVARLKTTVTALANEQLEIVRNLPYADVGLVGGLPVGTLPPLQTLVRDNITFSVRMTIRNVDDPFDGTIGGDPNDLSPADYKLVAVQISCPDCRNLLPEEFTTIAAPEALETTSTNGALFVQVFDAVGQPVPDADVHIVNSQAAPPIVIDDTTNANGLLQVVDAPPGVEAYEITVSRSGYSTERTYPIGDPPNPNPITPHATVALQQVTEISFAIDRTSTLDVSSVTDTCTPVPNIDFTLAGSKRIGTAPDILKYSTVQSTDGAGTRTMTGLEWDTYTPTLTDASYDLVGSIPLVPTVLNPGVTQPLQFIMAPTDPQSLLLSVQDASTQLPLSEATVRLEGPGGYDTTIVTGRGFLRQTDWSGGEGQDAYVDPTRYFDSDGTVEGADPAGEMHLWHLPDGYVPSGFLESSTFDTGSPSDFHQISWQPQDQPPATGADSVRFQIATNNDATTWNFLGPDGTPDTFYTLTDATINPAQSGNRYGRYRIFLQTADVTVTPTVADVALTFTSSCVPPGQAFFSGLAGGDYTATIARTGYQTVIDTVPVTAAWQERDVLLTP